MKSLLQLFQKKLFTDTKGAQLYYDQRRQIAYRIVPEELRLFSLYYNRFLICVLGSIVAIILNVTYPALIITIAVLVFCVSSYYFYKRLLPRLPMHTSCSLEKLHKLYKIEPPKSEKKSVVRVLILVVFAVLVVVNAHMSNYTGTLLYANYGVAALVALECIRQLCLFR